MVLRASQFVVGISSTIGIIIASSHFFYFGHCCRKLDAATYICEIADGKPLAQSSGFWIDFDNESRTGTVVTTALLIRTKHPTQDAWFCKDQYASDAKVSCLVDFFASSLT
jgi:hypothetical protein